MAIDNASGVGPVLTSVSMTSLGSIARSLLLIRRSFLKSAAVATTTAPPSLKAFASTGPKQSDKLKNGADMRKQGAEQSFDMFGVLMHFLVCCHDAARDTKRDEILAQRRVSWRQNLERVPKRQAISSLSFAVRFLQALSFRCTAALTRRSSICSKVL